MASGIRASRREDVVRLLDESDEPLTIHTMAERLGMHPNTVRLHVDRLLADDRVEMTKDARGVPGRPAQLYRRVRTMDGESARRYRVLAEILVDELGQRPDPTEAAIEAGRRWGRREAEHTDTPDPMTGLVEVLDRIGFGPQPNGDGRVDVCHCPFLELAQRRPDVVCNVHLGIMQGALRAWDADVTVDRLERREHPDVCVAHLSGSAPRRPDEELTAAP